MDIDKLRRFGKASPDGTGPGDGSSESPSSNDEPKQKARSAQNPSSPQARADEAESGASYEGPWFTAWVSKVCKAAERIKAVRVIRKMFIPDDLLREIDFPEEFFSDRSPKEQVTTAECSDTVDESIPRKDLAVGKGTGGVDHSDSFARRGGREERSVIPQEIIKPLAAIANHWWRAAGRLESPGGEEAGPELRKLNRNIEGIGEALKTLGIQIKDRSGEPYDPGYPEKVIVAEPVVGITSEFVKETIKPSIFWNSQLIQIGEITISTPASQPNSTNDEPQHD